MTLEYENLLLFRKWATAQGLKVIVTSVSDPESEYNVLPPPPVKDTNFTLTIKGPNLQTVQEALDECRLYSIELLSPLKHRLNNGSLDL